MNICRITAIKPDGAPWGTPPNGPLYPFHITFADGASGQANAKTNPPAYKVGDEVGYLVNGSTPRGVPKLKIDRKADPAQCPNTTPQDSHPDLEAAPASDLVHRGPPAQTTLPKPPVGRQAGFEGQGRGESGRPATGQGTPVKAPLNGAMVGGALKEAVNLWIAANVQNPHIPEGADIDTIEAIARDMVSIQQRIESGKPQEYAEEPPF